MALDRLSNITRSGLGSVHTYDVGGVISTGVITATAFVGDISQATGAAAGLGTALSEDQSSPLNKIYYTNQILSVDSTVTINPPDSSNIAYTQYAEIAVEDGYDLIVEDGDDLIPDILGLSTVTVTPLSGAGGRIRADQFTNKAGTGAPTFTSGLNVSGGLVGIGTQVPGSALEVFGSGAVANVKAEGQTNARVRIQAGNTSSSFLEFGDSDDADVGEIVYDHSDNHMHFNTNATERLRITSAGQLLLGRTGTQNENIAGIGYPNIVQIEGGAIGAGLGVGNTAAAARINISRDIPTSSITNNMDLGFISFGAESPTSVERARIQCNSDFTNANARGGNLIFYTSGDGSFTPAERLRITGGGDVLIGGQSAYTYDDTGASNTILDIWNSGNNKRGILSLSGQTNGGASIGTIWFNNDNNSSPSPGNNMKLSAAIQSQAVTSDGNAGNDAGATLQFLTKPEGSPMVESMRITSIGDIYQRDQRVHTCLHAEYRQLSGGVNTDSVGSWVDIKNFGYTPKRAGSLVVCHFQVQTWNGSQTDMNGDIYFRARFDQGTGTYVSVTYGGNNNRMTGNFDADNRRQHLYYTHTFGFTAQNTNQHTINLQASNGSSLSTDFNWFHTADNANGCWIFEYDN